MLLNKFIMALMNAADVMILIDGMRRVGNDTFRVEAKRARGGPPSRLWETISAFANAQGGIILLGIDERTGFAVTGVEEPRAHEAHLANLCSTQMEPPVRAIIETVELEGRRIVVAEIPAVARRDRPTFYRGEGAYHGSYVRVSDGDRRLTEYEVASLLADRGQPVEDERAINRSTRADLDGDLVEGYLRRLRRDKPRLFQGGDDEALRLTRVLVPDESGQRLVCSTAGLLALGIHPQSFLPQVDLTLVVYPRTERGEPSAAGARFLDNVSFDGPIPAIADDAMARLRQRMARRSIISGVARRDVYEYPEEAVREALVNALAHRDLSAGALGAQVQVEMFPDRLEVRNPGGLHGPVSALDLLTKSTSSARNASLYKILENVPLPDGSGTVCENRGSGIRAMAAALRAAGMSLPQFQDEIAFFQVTFPNATLLDDETVAWLGGLGQRGLTDSQVQALAQMRHGEVMRNAVYRQVTGVDSRVATAELRDLVSRGVIVDEGQRGTTVYQLARPSAGVSRTKESQLADDREVPELVRSVWNALAAGPKTRQQLQAELSLTQSTVLYRLRLLRAAGLVTATGPIRSPSGGWMRTQIR